MAARDDIKRTVPEGEHLWVRAVLYRLEPVRALEIIEAEAAGHGAVLELSQEAAMPELTPGVFCFLCQSMFHDVHLQRCKGGNAIIVPGS